MTEHGSVVRLIQTFGWHDYGLPEMENLPADAWAVDLAHEILDLVSPTGCDCPRDHESRRLPRLESTP